MVWLPVPERVGSKVLPILNKSLSFIGSVRKCWMSNRNPLTDPLGEVSETLLYVRTLPTT
jgi:hypothetical protein